MGKSVRIAQIRIASYLTTVVDGGRRSAVAPEGAQIQYSTVFPKERMLRRDIRRANGSAVWGWRRVGMRESSYLTALVHKRGKSIVTLTQRSQISQQSVLPEKCAALARKAEIVEGIPYIVLHKPDNLVAIGDSERQVSWFSLKWRSDVLR